jgi:hypothetical protein
MTGLRMTAWWAAVAGALLLVLGWGPLVKWADLNPNMAAWVQAIGSIGAILVAVWISYLQSAQQTRATRQAATERQESLRKIVLAVVRNMAEAAARTVNARKAEEESPFYRALAQKSIIHTAQPLQALPIYEVKDLDIVQQVLSLTRDVGLLAMGLERGDITAGAAHTSLLTRCNNVLRSFGEPVVNARPKETDTSQVSPRATRWATQFRAPKLSRSGHVIPQPVRYISR